MYGYKTAQDRLVILKIPKSAKCNVGRNNVKFEDTAKYRCSKAKVMAIMDWETGEYKSQAQSDSDNGFIYRLGKTVKTKYKKNSNTVCAKGIHFFTSEFGAWCYWKNVVIHDATHLRYAPDDDGNIPFYKRARRDYSEWVRKINK